MKLQMLNSFTNFLEKSVNKTPNLVVALPDLPDLNYISHSDVIITYNNSLEKKLFVVVGYAPFTFCTR